MPLFPSRKKGPLTAPIGGHLTEEEYVSNGSSEPTASAHKRIPKFHLTEEEYVETVPQEEAQKDHHGTQNGHVNTEMHGHRVSPSGASESHDKPSSSGGQSREEGLGSVNGEGLESTNGVGVQKGEKVAGQAGSGGTNPGAKKGGFWKRALSMGRKEKNLAVGAVTEEEYFEPPKAALKAGEVGAYEEKSIRRGGVYESLNLPRADPPGESRQGVREGDSVRGEALYERLASEKEEVKRMGGQMRGQEIRGGWNGPGVDDDLARHERDLRTLMLPRRPGFEIDPWDPSAAAPFDFGTVDRVAIRVRILPGGMDCPPVVFKSDGKRFKDLSHTDTSIKLREEVDYFFGLKVMPPLPIKSHSADLQVFSSLKGEDSGTLHEVGKLALTETREGYCAHWRCRLPASKNGDRRRMFLKLEIEGIGWIELPMLAKVYTEDDRGSSTYGFPLGALFYRCRADPEGSLMGHVSSMDILDCPWNMEDRATWKRPGK